MGILKSLYLFQMIYYWSDIGVYFIYTKLIIN